MSRTFSVSAPACPIIVATLAPPAAQYSRGEEGGEALPQMNDGQSTTHPEPDPAPFKVHLLTRAGRVMRARSCFDLRHRLLLQLLYPVVVIIRDCRGERHRSGHSDLS